MIDTETDELERHTRQCWICLETETFDTSSKHASNNDLGHFLNTQIQEPQHQSHKRRKRWVAPCRCRGTAKWVHQSCLLRWIRTSEPNRSASASATTCIPIRLSSDSGPDQHLLYYASPVTCPQCHYAYRIVAPAEGAWVLRLWQRTQRWYERRCVPYTLMFGSLATVMSIILGYSVIAVQTWMGLDAMNYERFQEALNAMEEVGFEDTLMGTVSVRDGRALTNATANHPLDVSSDTSVPIVAESVSTVNTMDRATNTDGIMLYNEFAMHWRQTMERAGILIPSISFILISARYKWHSSLSFILLPLTLLPTLQRSINEVLVNAGPYSGSRTRHLVAALGSYCMKAEVWIALWPALSALYGRYRSIVRRRMMCRLLREEFGSPSAATEAAVEAVETRDDYATVDQDANSLSPTIAQNENVYRDQVTEGPFVDDPTSDHDIREFMDDLENEDATEAPSLADSLWHHVAKVTTALAYPFMCNFAGHVLFREYGPRLVAQFRQVLFWIYLRFPVTWTQHLNIPYRSMMSFFPTLSFIQFTPFHQNFVGGACLVLAKDTFQLAHDYYALRSQLRRRVLDYSESTVSVGITVNAADEI